MSDKFENKYRISSARWQEWDYRTNAAYFITISTKNKAHYFGEINNDAMQLSHIGVLADVFWCEIKNHAYHVILDVFTVMPNHVHGIIIIDNNGQLSNSATNSTSIEETRQAFTESVNSITGMKVAGNETIYMETRHALSLPLIQPQQQQPNETLNTIGKKRFQNQGKNSISAIVGSYKAAVTKHANRLGYEFAWQARFHDHVIRDEKSYKRIANYIESNVKNWKADKFYN